MSHDKNSTTLRERLDLVFADLLSSDKDAMLMMHHLSAKKKSKNLLRKTVFCPPNDRDNVFFHNDEMVVPPRPYDLGTSPAIPEEEEVVIPSISDLVSKKRP